MPYVIKTSSENRSNRGISRFFAGTVAVPNTNLGIFVPITLLLGAEQFIPISPQRPTTSFLEPVPGARAGFCQIGIATSNKDKALRYPWVAKFLADETAKSLVAKTEVVYDLPKPIKWLQKKLSPKPV